MPEDDQILKIDKKKEESFLRKKTEHFTFSEKGEPIADGKKFTRSEMNGLIQEMKRIMHKANGIGLSANQIGLPYQMFIAKVPTERGGDYKFYAVLNPTIEKSGTEKVPLEEGCLSIPGIYGHVERPDRITLAGFDKNGKPLKIKAWGILARVFQHEVDHLNGKLFIDRTKKLHKVIDREEVSAEVKV